MHTRAVAPDAWISRGLRLANWASRLVVYPLLVFLFLAPTLWMIFGSLRPDSETYQYLFPFGWHTLVPIEWTLDHYLTIFALTESRRPTNFGKHFLNSAYVASGIILLSLLVNTLAAYFFARLRFPGKRWLMLFVLATLVIPSEATIVPLYMVVRDLGIQNSFAGLIIPWYASPFVVFALTQFMREQISYELDEAAMIDGAGLWTVLWRVLVPSIIPGLVTVSLLEFQVVWNMFYWPLVMIADRDLQLLQVVIGGTVGPNSLPRGRTFAGASLATVPVVLVFLLLQRYYVQGVASTGVKG